MRVEGVNKKLVGGAEAEYQLKSSLSREDLINRSERRFSFIIGEGD